MTAVCEWRERKKMQFITLEGEMDFDGWRTAARALALNDVAPADVTWTVKGNQPELFEPTELTPPLEPPDRTFNVPARLRAGADRDPASRPAALCHPVPAAVAAAEQS